MPIMRVLKYIPDRMFGFVVDDSGQEVFFHLGSFDPGSVWLTPSLCTSCHYSGSCLWASFPPPPILGEEVDVVLDTRPAKDADKAPRAVKVARRVGPPTMTGVVDTFDPQRGYGFVKGEEDGVSYHLHSSEILDGRIPRPGQRVMFFAGLRTGKPRACHVKVCPN